MAYYIGRCECGGWFAGFGMGVYWFVNGAWAFGCCWIWRIESKHMDYITWNFRLGWIIIFSVGGVLWFSLILFEFLFVCYCGSGAV